MFSIDRQSIKRELSGANVKQGNTKTNPIVHDQFKLKMWNMVEHIEEQSIYETGQWIISQDRVFKNQRGKENTQKYNRGEIVMVDLGASNFKYEPSFEHPGVVLYNTYRFILIAPASSKKFGTGFPEIIDATVADGFKVDSGIQMQGVRWVHKNRVTVKLGSIKNAGILDKIDDYLIATVPKYKDLVVQLQGDLQKKEELLAKREARIRSLKRRARTCSRNTKRRLQ